MKGKEIQTDMTQLEKENRYYDLIVGKDIIFRLIMSKFEKHPLLFSFLCVLIFSVPIPLIGIFEGVFYNTSLSPDIFRDIGFWSLYFGAIPFFCYFSIFYYSKLPRVFYSLYNNNVLKASKYNFNIYVGKMYNEFNNIKLLILIYSVSFYLFIKMLFIFNFVISGSWHKLGTESFITYSNLISLPGIFMAVYIIAQFSIRLLMGCFFLIMFFNEFDMDIKIFHPDKCGGAGCVGDLSKHLNIMIFFLGILISLGIYNNMEQFNLPLLHFINIIQIIFYISGAFLVIFSPLIAAHKKMVKAKSKVLRRISLNFEILNKELWKNLEKTGQIEKNAFEQMQRINEYYSIAQKYPVWPFNIKVIYGFLGSISPPVGLFILKTILEKIV